MQFHSVAGDIFLLDEFPALSEAERHDVANIVRAGDDGGFDVGFLDVVDFGLVGHAGGVVHLLHVAVFVIDLITHVRHGRDDVHGELAVKTLLDDFHVEESEEAAAETEAQCHGRFRLEGEGSVVQTEFLKAGAQLFEVLCFNGIDTGKDHRFHFFKSRNGFGAGILDGGEGVADLHFGGSLDATDDVAHVAATEDGAGLEFHLQNANLVGIIFLFRVDEKHFLSGFQATVDNFEIGDDATEGVEDGVKDECLKRCLGVSFGSGDAGDDGVQDFLHAFSGFSGSMNDF